MEEVKVSIPNVYLSDLERLAAKIRNVTGDANPEVSFEFIIASLFPTSWKNIQSDLNRQYTQGYLQGRKDKEEEMRNHMRSMHDDADCYCE